MKKTVLAMLLLGLSACNTFEGMGRDVESAANWVMGEDDAPADAYARQPMPQQQPVMNPQYPANQPVQNPYYYQ